MIDVVEILAKRSVLKKNRKCHPRATQPLEGTPIHPIWSLDREDWVALGDLQSGEQLSGKDGPVKALSLHLITKSQPVYNIEVHGEHVYEVGDCCVLVHNSTPCTENVIAAVSSATKPIIRSGVNRTIEANKQTRPL